MQFLRRLFGRHKPTEPQDEQTGYVGMARATDLQTPEEQAATRARMEAELEEQRRRRTAEGETRIFTPPPSSEQGS